MQVYKITPGFNKETGKGLNPYCEKNFDAVGDWLRDAEPGEVILVEVIEMSEEVCSALPEYMGP